MTHPNLWGTTDTRNGLPTTTRESPDFSHGECQLDHEATTSIGGGSSLAISVLEKQMPKKIKKFTYPKNIVYMYCPECDEGIDENNLFCSRCGQKLDWEVENE